MKTIGIIGGMSWQSTQIYYRHLNTMMKARLGGLASARILMASVNFAPLEKALAQGDDDFLRNTLIREAKNLEAGGAEVIILATNTMHRFAPDIEAATTIPFLHIADALGAAVRAKGIKTLGLLGTRFTMTQDFYTARLQERFGIATLIPDEAAIAETDRIIFEELCLGETHGESRDYYLGVMDDLAGRGTEAIALACTEIEMLVKPGDTRIALLDTTELHAEAAVAWSLGE